MLLGLATMESGKTARSQKFEALSKQNKQKTPQTTANQTNKHKRRKQNREKILFRNIKVVVAYGARKWDVGIKGEN